jgi:diguanylate cyclase (GGDEF)-like protein
VDGLTDLPNRTRFLETFAHLPAGSARAVAVLNIDRFALINTALGYQVGDRLLRELGERLSKLSPAPAMVARLWGARFAFLLDIGNEDDARAFAAGALEQLRDPITLDGQRLDIGGSIGIALYPQDGLDAGTLLRRAELALAAAKRRRSGLAFAHEAGEEPAPEQLSLIGDMRAAMADGQFVLAYQPKLDLANGRIVAAEALLRWRHPQRGMVPPVSFIPFAEQTGFIREITPWVLDAAIRQLAQWRAQGIGIAVSANLSTLDLLDPIADSPRNAAIVQSTIMLSHALGLSVVAEGVETQEELAWLRANGCDVGQGYGIARPMMAADLPGWLAGYATSEARVPGLAAPS